MSVLALAEAGGKTFGLEWDAWKAVGWMGTALFTSRFLVQWWATERHRRVVVPTAFWWLSLGGAGCLLAYAIHARDIIFVFAYLFSWIPYIRNLLIGRRTKDAESRCPSCGTASAGPARFCAQCGMRVAQPGLAGQEA